MVVSVVPIRVRVRTGLCVLTLILQGYRGNPVKVLLSQFWLCLK